MTKLNASGSALVYSTYLGGTAADGAEAIAVNETSGVVTVVGGTASSDFPTIAGAPGYPLGGRRERPGRLRHQPERSRVGAGLLDLPRRRGQRSGQRRRHRRGRRGLRGWSDRLGRLPDRFADPGRARGGQQRRGRLRHQAERSRRIARSGLGREGRKAVPSRTGARANAVFRDPSDDERIWVVFDWDEEGYNSLLEDPEFQVLFDEAGLKSRPVKAEFARPRRLARDPPLHALPTLPIAGISASRPEWAWVWNEDHGRRWCAG